MQNQINNNEIHCKVQYGDEFRRFLLQGSYATMLEQIRALFQFHDEELSIKYTDDEGDLVTISSDEELAFAIELFPNSVLRLTLACPTTHRHWKGYRDGSHCGKWAHDDKDKWERMRAEKAEFWRAKKAFKAEKREAKRACKGGEKWESKRACKAEKWESKRAHWEAKKEKILNDPELRKEKLEHLDYKLKKLQERKQWLQGQVDANINPSFAHRLAHITTKINRIESFRAMLVNSVATSPVTLDPSKGHKWESKRACRAERWETKKACNPGKWESKRAYWEAKKEKILNDPELRKEKLEHLDYKLKKLQERKQFLQSKVDVNPSFAHRLAHLNTKISFIESFRANLANPVATSPIVAPIAKATPF